MGTQSTLPEKWNAARIQIGLRPGSCPSPIFALVQALQAIQLMNGPAATAKPVIMAGDFNTVANNPSSPTFLTYLFILGNGFTDGWLRAHPFLPGLTCCQEDLTSSTSALTQRLDLVFARNHISVLGAQLVGNHLDTIPNVGSSWPSEEPGVCRSRPTSLARATGAVDLEARKSRPLSSTGAGFADLLIF
jgi:endonuclease/exonuclease/phosphatase family protein